MPDSPQDSPRPFTAQADPAALADLRARLRATRWPDAPQDAGWSLGTDVSYLRELGGHFAPFEEPELYAQELREFFRPYRH
jgi:pimeloyl-ACP methyl ester carboxylesterase